MKCPECAGKGIVLVPTDNHSSFAMGCPTCQGTREVPDPIQYPDHCLACGQPILAGQKWCDFHKASELFEGGEA